ncbi:MAG: TonB family protein [Deltaproteobacteria bacterium]
MTSRMFHKASFGNSGNPYNMFFASLLLHLIVIAAVLMTVPGSSKPLTFGAPYSVALVGPEALEEPGGFFGPKDLPSAQAVGILKRDPAGEKTAALAKKTETEKPDIEKALDALKQKAPAAAEAPPASPAATAASPAAAQPARHLSATDDYTRLVWSKVKRNWTLPAALMPKNQLEAVIDVRIGQSGALEYVGFEKRSGNAYFDESALRAVKKSAPFPPLAGRAAGHSVEIGIRFHSSEIQPSR